MGHDGANPNFSWPWWPPEADPTVRRAMFRREETGRIATVTRGRWQRGSRRSSGTVVRPV